MGSLLSRAGAFIAIAGLVSLGLALFLPNYEVRILKWITIWGETMAWTIRGGLVVGGGILFFVGNMLAPDSADDD